MKHKLTALLLACSLALTLCACGGKETDDTQTDAASPSTDADSSAISNAETTGDLPTDRVYTADTGEIFQEDLAWVRFHDNIGEYYVGAVDKTGELRFYFPDTYDQSTKITDFEDGQAFVEVGGSLLLIDAKGNVKVDYARAMPDETVIAYGGGYVISSHNEAGSFDTAAKTVYTLTDASGSAKALGDSKSGSLEKIKYYGSGAFFGGGVLVYEGERVDLNVNSESWMPIVEGGHIILADHSNGQFICWDLATGAGLKTEALYDSYTSFIGVEGDLVLLAVLEDITPGALEPGYYLYNLADGSLKPYNGQYVGWLHPDMDQYVYAYWGRCRDRGRFVSGRFSGGQFGILLKGADKMPYFAFLDTDMNELTEPIQMSDYIIDGDYIISDTGIRSLDGTLLNDGSFTDLNDAISGGRVANGVISAKDGSCYGYDGQLLFDGIDYFQAKLVGTN